jgi:hypothetical protein
MSETKELIERLAKRTVETLPRNWKDGRLCPECGMSSERQKCAFEMGGACPRHDPTAYDPSPYIVEPDITCTQAASLLASQAEEIERLKALAICGPLGHPQGCGVCERCKAETQLAYADAKISRLTRERDEALEALKPFAEMLEHYPDSEPDYHVVVWEGRNPRIQVADLRRARSVLQSSSDRKSPDE